MAGGLAFATILTLLVVLIVVIRVIARAGDLSDGELRPLPVLPGLINTHHHFYQTLTRAVPAAQNALLFGWLQTLYPIWARFGPEEMFVSAQVGLAELALSGCTMSSDHLYLYPNGARLDDTIEAAAAIGLRLHVTRGGMSIGESDGGLPWWLVPTFIVAVLVIAGATWLGWQYIDPARAFSATRP